MLANHIWQFGNQIELTLRADAKPILEDIKQFDSDWHQYNVFKPNIKRWTDMLFEREAFKKAASYKHDE